MTPLPFEEILDHVESSPVHVFHTCRCWAQKPAVSPGNDGPNGVIVSVALPVLLLGLVSFTPAGGLTVTMLVIEPVAAGSTVPFSVIATLLPLVRFSPLHTPVVEL